MARRRDASMAARGAGESYAAPTGRGVTRLAGRDGFGRCQACARSTQPRQDGTVINHRTGADRCAGSLLPPAEMPALANWPPLAGRSDRARAAACFIRFS